MSVIAFFVYTNLLIKACSVGAHEQRKAAMAAGQVYRHRGLALLVRSYRKHISIQLKEPSLLAIAMMQGNPKAD